MKIIGAALYIIAGATLRESDALKQLFQNIYKTKDLELTKINIRNNEGSSLLHLALNSVNQDFAKFLIKKGVKLNLQNNDGDTPLHFALKSNMLDITKLLEEKNVKLDLQNKDGDSPLHLALKSSNLQDLKVKITKIYSK